MFGWILNAFLSKDTESLGKMIINKNFSLRKKRPYSEFFFGPHFPAFRLNKEIYSVNLRIQSKCRKMRTRKTLNTDTLRNVSFHRK